MARAKNPFLKKANQQEDFTGEQILELKKCMEDPIYFIMTYCMIQHTAHGAIPFALYGYQQKMIQTFNSSRLTIVLSARQSGKSWCSAAFLLWWAMFKFEQTVVVLSNKDKNAMEMIHRIRFIYERLPLWLKPGLLDDGWNKHEVGFDNGSRIISSPTSEDSARGFSASLLFLDEFAFVRDAVQEQFWGAVSPTFSTGGNCIICSTPNGDVNQYAQLWRGAQVDSNGFAPVEIKWDEPPGRDETFKEQEIARIGETRWKQEYECQFLSSDPLLIDTVALANLTNITKQFKPVAVLGDVMFWKLPQANTTYLIGIDPATGTGRDFTAFTIFEFPSMEQVGQWRSNTMSSVSAYQHLKRVLRIFEKVEATVYFSIENNGVGEGIIALYEADELPPETAEFISETGQKRKGMVVSGKSKMRACLAMKEMVERSTLQVKSPLLVQEMKQFVRQQGTYGAKRGATDDLVTSVLIVIRLLEEISHFEQDAYDKLYSQAYYKEIPEETFNEDETPDPIVF